MMNSIVITITEVIGDISRKVSIENLNYDEADCILEKLPHLNKEVAEIQLQQK